MKKFCLIVNCLLFCLVAPLVASPPEIPSNDVCEILPTRDLPISQVQERNYPSVALWPHSSATEETFVKYDYHYGYPYLEYNGRITAVVGDFDTDVKKAEKLTVHLRKHNPEALIFFGTFLYTEQSGTFAEDSDVWLRDANGERVAYYQDAWAGWNEYQIDFVKPHVQEKLVDMIVAVAECGIFDGVALDGFAHNGTGFVGRHLHPATDAEIIEATANILRKVRERVRDDFLIIVNARGKLKTYAKYINGDVMEAGPGEDDQGGYTHAQLQFLDDILLWNAKNLRFPQVNWSEGFLIEDQSPDSPDNLRWVRVFTTRGMILDNGYVSIHHETAHVANEKELWYRFWDAPLGRPIGAIGQLYDNREGLFIREFSNGWAVYNRSGKAQEIRIPGEASTGWSSGITGVQHTLGDLDSEIYLKLPVWDVNADGETNILDLVLVANAINQPAPDVNGDGVVNILDLVLVANHIGE